MAFSERITRLKSSLIREILAAAQRPEVMSFAGGLPAEAMLPAVDWAELPASMARYSVWLETTKSDDGSLPEIGISAA